MRTLEPDQKASLVEIVREWHGSDLEYPDFAEALLGLFEDIAGFEAITTRHAIRIVNELWEKYCEQGSTEGRNVRE